MEIAVSTSGPLTHIQLNRPDVRNSFNPEMIKALTHAFEKADSNRQVRAVILSGAGNVFCAGADLQWMQSMVKFTLEQNRRDSEILYRMFEAIAECPLPVIGQAHGAAFGGALGLLAACDYVIAEKDTKFCFSEVKLGIAPAVISPFISRKCLLAAVKPYMLNASVLNAETAQRVGLVNEVVAGNQALATAVMNYANTFLECGPEAVRETKKMLQEIDHLSWEDQRTMTTTVISERRVSAEGQEGLTAFLQKRKPSWSPN